MIERIKTLLLDAGINPASTIEYDVNGTVRMMSLQEIAEHYMQASPESQEIFVTALTKAIAQGKHGVQTYFEKMGELLLLSAFGSES